MKQHGKVRIFLVMGILDNQRHELFAQNVVKGMSLTDAYVDAGYKKSDAAACRLSGNVKIKDRIQEIREASAERAEITRASVLELIQDIIEEARDANQFGPAMTGAVKLGVDIGMFEQKSTNKHLIKSLDSMSEEELAAFLGTQS